MYYYYYYCYYVHVIRALEIPRSYKSPLLNGLSHRIKIRKCRFRIIFHRSPNLILWVLRFTRNRIIYNTIQVVHRTAFYTTYQVLRRFVLSLTHKCRPLLYHVYDFPRTIFLHRWQFNIRKPLLS